MFDKNSDRVEELGGLAVREVGLGVPGADHAPKVVDGAPHARLNVVEVVHLRGAAVQLGPAARPKEIARGDEVGEEGGEVGEDVHARDAVAAGGGVEGQREIDGGGETDKEAAETRLDLLRGHPFDVLGDLRELLERKNKKTVGLAN